MPYRILMVEDEPKVQRFVRQALETAGFQVETLDELTDLETYVEQLKPEVLLLDRLVGRQDSLALLGRLRRKFPELKILVLSALGELDQRVAGLEVGADDYLPKPFHVSELVARVKSLGRRATASSTETSITYEDLEIRLETQEVLRAQRPVSLTAKEFKILSLLAKKPLKIFSKAELLDRIWGINADPGSNVVEVTMNRLRAKVDEDSAEPLIHTRRGAGYWFGRVDQEP